MALSLGSSLADKIYLGATEVALAYLGTTQVYTSAAGASYLFGQRLRTGALTAWTLRVRYDYTRSWTSSAM